MAGKIVLLVVALLLLSATLAAAGPRVNELDSNPSPSDVVLSQAVIPVYNSTDVWPGTMGPDNQQMNGPNNLK